MRSSSRWVGSGSFRIGTRLAIVALLAGGFHLQVITTPSMAQRVILDENFDDDTPDTLPDSLDFYARSSVLPDPGLDPSTAVVTGATFADPFDPGNNQSFVLSNPNGTTQMAATWTDEFMNDPSTFRNGSIEFDLYMEKPDPAAFWTFFGIRVGHGDETRSSVSGQNADTTIWTTLRLQNLGEPSTLVEQIAAHDQFINFGAFDTFADNGDDLFGPDRAFHVRYDIDGTGTTFPADPPIYTLSVSSTPIVWSEDGMTENIWVAQSVSPSIQFAPGINIFSFFK